MQGGAICTLLLFFSLSYEYGALVLFDDFWAVLCGLRWDGDDACLCVCMCMIACCHRIRRGWLVTDKGRAAVPECAVHTNSWLGWPMRGNEKAWYDVLLHVSACEVLHRSTQMLWLSMIDWLGGYKRC